MSPVVTTITIILRSNKIQNGDSPFWILLDLRMMVMVVTTGAIGHAKRQSNHHHQQTSTQLFTGQMPILSPNQQYQSTYGHYMAVM